MAITSAIPAKGTLLQLRTVADPVQWDTVAEVTNINDLTYDRAVARATHLNSPSGAEEYVAAEHNVGVSFDVNFLPNDQTHISTTGLFSIWTQFIQDLTNSGSVKFRIILPDGGNETYTFDGFVGSFAISAQGGDVLRGTLTLRGTGTATIT